MMSASRALARCAAVVAMFAMLVTGVATASAVPLEGDTGRVATGVEGLPCPYGVRYTPYPSDQGNPPDISHWYTRCGGKYVEISYDNPTKVVSGCMGDNEVYLGPKYPYPSFLYWTRQSFRDTNIIRDCDPNDPGIPQLPFPDPIEYPWVQVSGTVQVSNDGVLGESPRPLANAEYGLFYLSQADDSSTWLPVRDNVCGEGQEVRGHLDGTGRFDLEFVYPQHYEECGGSTWTGCPATEPVIPWLHSHACADDALVLRVYATNADASVRVVDNEGTTRVIGEIPLGRYFDRVVNHVYIVDDPAARAYLGVHDFHTAYTSANVPSAPTTIRLLPGNAPTRYLPEQGIAEVGEDNTAGTDPEFAAGIAHFHDLTGPEHPSVPAECTPDLFTLGSTELCALITGYAAALANQAEEPSTTSNGLIHLSGTTIDIERCGTPQGPGGDLISCHDGPTVAGRVAAFFRDLADSDEDNEQLDGFTDTVGYPVTDIPTTIGLTKPMTVDEVWAHWRTTHPDTTRLAMFWNTLGYTDLQDEDETTSVANVWTTQPCPTCRGDDLAWAVPNGAATNRGWDVNRHLDQDAVYDVWVRVPAGHPEYTDMARYVVHTADGVRSFTVNQRDAVDGWVNLNPDGVGRMRPEDDNLIFVNTDFASTSSLIADAMILAPHESDVPVGPAPPVRVDGVVKVAAASGNSLARPLNGARYELLYRDTAGQWRPVLSGTGPNGEPAGPAVTGELGRDGDYDVEFRYPNRIPLNDGTWWTGCAEPANPVDFMGSYACADEDLVLRVYSVNADESIRVEHDGIANEIGIADDVPLGQFFLRGPLQKTRHATSVAAHAYGAVNNVEDLAGPYLDTVLIEMFPGDADDISSYTPATRTINLNHLHALSSTAEHEVAHALEHDLVGFPLEVPCTTPKFDMPSSDSCAWTEGFATFIATAAERLYAEHPNEPPRYEGEINVESCENNNCANRGPLVLGSVAMLLYDLWDHTPGEVVNGFHDESTYSTAAILDVIRDAKPDTFAEFWAAWRARYGDVDNETIFLNALGYVHLSDAGDAQTDAQGAWESRTCTSGCTGGSLLLSAGTASMAWHVGPSIKEAGRYDIWVRIPPGSGAREASARYRVDTAAGPLSAFVDHSTAEGWVNLRSAGFDLAVDEEARMTLTHSTADHEAPIVADAILVFPHADQ